jgi:hypothetical protein
MDNPNSTTGRPSPPLGAHSRAPSGRPGAVAASTAPAICWPTRTTMASATQGHRTLDGRKAGRSEPSRPSDCPCFPARPEQPGPVGVPLLLRASSPDPERGAVLDRPVEAPCPYLALRADSLSQGNRLHDGAGSAFREKQLRIGAAAGCMQTPVRLPFLVGGTLTVRVRHAEPSLVASGHDASVDIPDRAGDPAGLR